MRLRTLMILILPLLVACGQDDSDAHSTADPAARATAERTHGTEPCIEVALFTVEGLDMDLAGKLVGALNGLPGVRSAKPAVADGKLAVEFTNPESTPKAIEDALEAAGASASLLSVVPAETGGGEKSGCAGCPSRSKCQGS